MRPRSHLLRGRAAPWPREGDKYLISRVLSCHHWFGFRCALRSHLRRGRAAPGPNVIDTNILSYNRLVLSPLAWLPTRPAQPSAAGSCGAKAKCDRLPMQPCAAICGGVVRRQRKAKTIFSGGDCFTNKIIALRRRMRTRDLAASSSLKLRRPLTMTARLWTGRRGNLDLLRSR